MKRYMIMLLCGMLIASGCGKKNVNNPSVSEQESTATIVENETAPSRPVEPDVQKTEPGEAEAVVQTPAGTEGTEPSESDDSEQTIGGKYGKKKDLDTSIPEDAVYITGNGNQVQIDGQGASAEGAVTITKKGTYVLTGTFDGQLRIDADKEDFVHLVLAGTTISCADSAAIYGVQSDKIVITLQDGTVNTVTDGTAYVYETAEEDEPNAAIFSKDDLTFNGSGQLIVNARYEDGIRTKDDLLFVSGTYVIDSVKDALQGKDSLTIVDGDYTITAGNDAVKSSNDTDADKGWVEIAGGRLQIEAEDDALHAETAMMIQDGEIIVTKSYEGIEGATVLINGGQISVKSSDDGINAADGSGSGMMGGFWGRGDRTQEGQMQNGQTDGAAASTTEVSITINGGELFIDADGDGIDSNDTLIINGGEIYIEGPTNNGNGAIDYERTGLIYGGTLLATGSSGMAMGFDGSEQCFFLYNFNSAKQAGSELTVADADGKVIFQRTIQKAYNSVVLSMPELEENGTYTLTCGGESVQITLNGKSYTNGSMGGFGGHGGMGGGRPGFGDGAFGGERPDGFGNQNPEEFDGQRPGREEGDRPEGFGGFHGQRPDGEEGNRPEGFEGFGGFGGQRPDGEEGNRPEGFGDFGGFGGQRPDENMDGRPEIVDPDTTTQL